MNEHFKRYSIFEYGIRRQHIEMVHYAACCCDVLNFGRNFAALFTLERKGISFYFSTLGCFNLT